MTRHRIVAQRTQDCHWSVPACRFQSMSEGDDEFETFWVCERAKEHRRVSQAECSRCPYRAPEHGRTPRKVS